MLKNVATIDQNILAQLYEFTIQNNNNIIVFGAPGIGKTAMAKQAVTQLGLQYQYINLSVLEAPDFIGFPQIINGRSSWAPPEFLPLIEDNCKSTVLIFDEIDKAASELQAPLLELFQFRSINGKKTKIKAIIATGNRPDDLSFSKPVSHALTNRCCVYNVSPSFKYWQSWARRANINPLVMGYLNNDSGWWLKPPSSGDDTEYAFPSPRSWTLAASDLDCAATDDNDFKYYLVAGRVGAEAAKQFNFWLRHYRVIQPLIKKLVEQGISPDIADSNFELSEERKLICAILAVRELVTTCVTNTNPNRAVIHKVAKHVFTWLNTIPSSYAVAAMRISLSMNLVRNYKLVELNEFKELFVSIEDDLEED